VWLGRRDFVINSGGVKLHPEQIENKIRTLEKWSVFNLFITKTADDKFGERPLLVLEEKQRKPNLDELMQVLTKLEMPKEVLFLPQFIYTENGKLNRTETIKSLGINEK